MQCICLHVSYILFFYPITSSLVGGVVQRKLNNGLRVNLKPLSTEPQRVAVRVYVPGGRILEDVRLPGSVLVGTFDSNHMCL